MSKENGPRIIQELTDALGISIYSLENKLGYKSRAVYHVANGVNALSEGMIRRIIEAFPNVDYNFLQTGLGKPLLRNIQEQAQKNIFNIQTTSDLNFLQRLYALPDKIDNIEKMLKQLLEEKNKEVKL